MTRIHKGLCVPFLGAGVNVKSEGYEGLPLGSEVALSLVGKLLGLDGVKLEDLVQVTSHAGLKPYQDLTRIALQDLSRVALRVESETDSPDFLEILKSILPDEKRTPSELLMILARLPFKLIVTTNYDRLLEEALELLHVNDIKDPAAVVLKLKDTANAVFQHLRDQFSVELRQMLDEYYNGADPPQESLCRALIEALNRVIKSGGLYQMERFELVELRTQTRSLLNQNPKGVDLMRLNRLLLEDAFHDCLWSDRRPYKVVVQPIKGFEGNAQTKLQDELAKHDGLIIYKIHGTFPNEGADRDTRLVITEEDYIEFLTFVGAKGEGIHPLITEKIVDSTLLFLGYGLEDWNFRTMFKGLIEKLPPREQRKSFAIQKNPSDFWVKFWSKKNVEIYDTDLYQFARDLENRYWDYVKKLRVMGSGR